MKTPIPTTVRTDVVARWIIARSRETLAQIMGRMIRIEADDVGFTVRGDGPSPVFDITTLGGGVATLVSGSEWLKPDAEAVATQVEDDGLRPPCLRLHWQIATLPETAMVSAIGRPLSDVVDGPRIEGLQTAIITAMGRNQDGMMEIALDPEWKVHRATSGWETTDRV